MPGDPTQKIYLPSARQVWREVRAVSPDIIIAATPGPFGFLGLVLAALYRTALAVGYHAEYSELVQLYWGSSLGRFSGGVVGLWERLMFRFGSLVLVNNEDLKNTAIRLGAADVRLMGTPIQRSFLDTPPKPLSERLESILFVGRLAAEKNVRQVLHAARDHPHLLFRMIGEGGLRSEVEKQAAESDNLEYLGWVPRHRVLDAMDESDLLVLPSRFETFGTVAFEAMVRRRLALVSQACGIVRWPELARGLFVMGEGESLTEAIRRVEAMEPSERDAVAQRGMLGARRLSHDTIQQWLEILVHTVAEQRFV
jgi:glycosyltransferase involved in cell wall biosynthesis